MNKILILLFVPFMVHAQYTAQQDGNTVLDSGRVVKIHDSNIAQPTDFPVVDPPDDFVGTIFKQITFSERTGTEENTDASAREYVGSDDINQSATPSSNDSIVILTINESADTVHKCNIQWDDSGSSGGPQWVGDAWFNNTDATGDTLTFINLTYYMMMSSNWRWGNSGKMLGVSAKDLDGGSPPSAGVFGPTCSSGNDYETDDGFSMRGGWDSISGGGDVGYYVYHQGFVYSGCVNPDDKHYGDTYNYHRDNGVNIGWEHGKWYKITHRHVINSTGNFDGIMEWYRNDTLYVKRDNIKHRKNGGILFDYYHGSNFAGGGSTGLYQDQQIYYDDVTLWREADQSAHDLLHVLDNVPLMPTPNTE